MFAVLLENSLTTARQLAGICMTLSVLAGIYASGFRVSLSKSAVIAEAPNTWTSKRHAQIYLYLHAFAHTEMAWCRASIITALCSMEGIHLI